MSESVVPPASRENQPGNAYEIVIERANAQVGVLINLPSLTDEELYELEMALSLRRADLLGEPNPSQARCLSLLNAVVDARQAAQRIRSDLELDRALRGPED